MARKTRKGLKHRRTKKGKHKRTFRNQKYSKRRNQKYSKRRKQKYSKRRTQKYSKRRRKQIGGNNVINQQLEITWPMNKEKPMVGIYTGGIKDSKPDGWGIFIPITKEGLRSYEGLFANGEFKGIIQTTPIGNNDNIYWTNYKDNEARPEMQRKMSHVGEMEKEWIKNKNEHVSDIKTSWKEFSNKPMQLVNKWIEVAGDEEPRLGKVLKFDQKFGLANSKHVVVFLDVNVEEEVLLKRNKLGVYNNGVEFSVVEMETDITEQVDEVKKAVSTAAAAVSTATAADQLLMNKAKATTEAAENERLNLSVFNPNSLTALPPIHDSENIKNYITMKKNKADARAAKNKKEEKSTLKKTVFQNQNEALRRYDNPTTEEKEAMPETKKCPHCDNQIPMNWNTCTKCYDK